MKSLFYTLILISNILLGQNIKFVEYPAFDPPGSGHLADIDADGDVDIVTKVTTFIPGTGSISKLERYINDGNGLFTQLQDSSFQNMSLGTFRLVDVNNDGAADLFNIKSVFYLADSLEEVGLYINDGSGKFTYKSDHPFEVLHGASFTFGDINGDTTMDLTITGYTMAFADTYRKCFTNDGEGNFTELPDAAIEFYPYGWAEHDLADVDGDSDLDLLISANPSRLYLNDGQGVFTRDITESISGLAECSAFGDYDQDGDQDIFSSSGGGRLFENDGLGNFNLDSIEVAYMNHPTYAEFVDIHRDGDLDLWLSGTRIYTSQTAGNISLITQGPNKFWEQVNHVAGFTNQTFTSFGDIDDDGDLDIFTGGKLYRNDTECVNVDVLMTETKIICQVYGAASYQWLDCDNDYSAIPNETSHKFIPSQNGNYAVEILETGCVDTSECMAFMHLDLVEIQKENATIYPNPGKGVFTVQLDKNYSNILLSLRNQLGQELFRQQLDNGSEIPLDIDLKSGSYLLNISTQEEKTFILKLIVE